MKLLNVYLNRYGNIYGSLLLLSYALLTSIAILIVAASHTSAFVILPPGAVALLVLQLFIRSNEIHIALGSIGMFISLGCILILLMSYQNHSQQSDQPEAWLEPCMFYISLGVASAITAASGKSQMV